MKTAFSTFDIVKATGVNRNTLQAALAAEYIEMDINRADGKSERSQSSLDGVYRIATFFQMVRSGIPRKKAWGAYSELNIEWKNVGFKPGLFRYLIRTELDPGSPNLLAAWRWDIKKSLPGQLSEGAKTCWIINIAAAKKQVDEGIAAIG